MHILEDVILGYENSKTIYIVVSQTGTILSRLLRLFTKAEYNHVSIALDENLDHMYSFGRTNPYNPIIGGFVSESPKFGTFKRFYKTRVVILSVVITIEQFNKLKSCMEHMFEKKNKYKSPSPFDSLIAQSPFCSKAAGFYIAVLTHPPAHFLLGQFCNPLIQFHPPPENKGQ